MLSSTTPVYENGFPQVTVIEGLRVRQDLIFSDHQGGEKRRVRKQAEKALQKLRNPLQKVLQADESIVYVVRCLAPVSPLEQFFLGWTAQYALAVTLVFTDRRLLHFNCDRKGAWRSSSIRSLAWSSLGSARLRGWLSPVMELVFADKKKQRYWSLPFGQRKKIKQLLLLLVGANQVGDSQALTWLCPECVKPLTTRVFRCENCGLVFKDKSTLRWRAILIPGGGYFYCRQPLLGVVHALGDSFLLLEIVVLGSSLLLYLLEQYRSVQNPPDMTSLISVLLFIIGLFALEKTVTLYHCRRFIDEFIPTGRKDFGTSGSKAMTMSSN